MDAMESTRTIAAVAVVVVGVIVGYVIYLNHKLRQADARITAWEVDQSARMDKTFRELQAWKDGYHSEAKRHADTRDSLEALRDSHAQLQEEFLAQGRELTLALAKAKAAERVE